MATGQLQGLRHEIRDIVGDGNTYNGLAGRAGLSFDEQRAEFNSVAPRVGEKVASLRAKADELESKKTAVEAAVAKALDIIADREVNGVPEVADEPDFPDEGEEDDEEFEDDDEEFDDDDFEEYEEEEDEDLKL